MEVVASQLAVAETEMRVLWYQLKIEDWKKLCQCFDWRRQSSLCQS